MRVSPSGRLTTCPTDVALIGALLLSIGGQDERGMRTETPCRRRSRGRTWCSASRPAATSACRSTRTTSITSWAWCTLRTWRQTQGVRRQRQDEIDGETTQQLQVAEESRRVPILDPCARGSRRHRMDWGCATDAYTGERAPLI